jgi:hypothetical protein
MEPKSKDAREKYEQTLKDYKLIQLQSCLQYEETRVTVNIEEIVVESSYSGPKL